MYYNQFRQMQHQADWNKSVQRQRTDAKARSSKEVNLTDKNSKPVTSVDCAKGQPAGAEAFAGPLAGHAVQARGPVSGEAAAAKRLAADALLAKNTNAVPTIARDAEGTRIRTRCAMTDPAPDRRRILLLNLTCVVCSARWPPAPAPVQHE